MIEINRVVPIFVDDKFWAIHLPIHPKGLAMLETIQPFILSFMIGLLIGIERERSHAEGIKTIGVRTFILFALLGTLSAKIHNPALTLPVSFFVFAALLLSYFRETRSSKKKLDFGVTTEMAAATVFMLGYLALEQRLLAVCIATGVLLILYWRQSLHRFAKQKITTKEIEAAIIILIISLAILSFLPNKAIDPWQLFNPQNFGMIVLILACLQFGGHIAIRLFGQRLGLMLLGFFGGLASSTAVFVALAQDNKTKKQTTYAAVITCTFATIATLIAFLVVLFVISPELLKFIIWPVLAAILIGGVLSFFVINKKNSQVIMIKGLKPLEIKSVLKLALLIISILLLVAISKQYFGSKSLPFTAFITGLFELQGITYVIALLYNKGSITMTYATQLLALVVVANFTSKFGIVWLVARSRFSAIMSLYLIGMLVAASMVYFFTAFLFPNNI